MEGEEVSRQLSTPGFTKTAELKRQQERASLHTNNHEKIMRDSTTRIKL